MAVDIGILKGLGQLHGSLGKRQAKACEDAVLEIDRLQQFRDAVLSAMTEHAGGQTDFAYIWQSEWDRIKAECGEPTGKDGGK